MMYPMCSTKAPELHVEIHKHGGLGQQAMAGAPASSSASTKVYCIFFVLLGLRYFDVSLATYYILFDMRRSLLQKNSPVLSFLHIHANFKPPDLEIGHHF